MKTIVVTGNDTGIGKTWVTGALARLLASWGKSVEIVKLVEAGVVDGESGDADRSATMAGADVAGVTLRQFRAAMAPVEAARAEGRTLCIDELVTAYRSLPFERDFRIVEGAGGIEVPLQDDGADIVDFAEAAGADALVIVVEDRLGAINQARLCWRRAALAAIDAGVWLNETGTNDAEVAASTRTSLSQLGIPLWAETKAGSIEAKLLMDSWIRE